MVKMVESELGMVPEGWEIKVLNDFIKFSNGKSIKPGGKGQYPVFGSNGIIGATDLFKFENGVVIGRVGAYCGSIVRCSTQFWASDNTIVAFPKDDFGIPFLFHLLQYMELNKYAGGAAQPLLTQSVLKTQKIVMPKIEICRKFDIYTMDALVLIDKLIKKNENLRSTRDLLLPKLISGDVDVQDLKINNGVSNGRS